MNIITFRAFGLATICLFAIIVDNRLMRKVLMNFINQAIKMEWSKDDN